MNSLRDYKLLTEFTAVGSGSARWCFAEKDGVNYFVKEFLSPVFPAKERRMADDHREKLIEICNRFWKRKERLYDALRRLNNGNIVAINDFFCDNNKFYSVCPKVEAADISCEHVFAFCAEIKLIIMRALVHCLRRLNQEHIVHADIKMDNVMIKQTASGFYTIKLIDFDNSFFEDDLPEDPEQIGGDPVYLAPETMLRMSGEDCELDHKIDIFALGIMFHQFWAGELPKVEAEEEWYIHEGVLEGKTILLDAELPLLLADLIHRMLSLDPQQRPDYEEIFDVLNEMSGRKRKSLPDAAEVCAEPPVFSKAASSAEVPKKKNKSFKPCGKL